MPLPIPTADEAANYTYEQKLAVAERMQRDGWTLDGAFAHLEGTCDIAWCPEHVHDFN